jgi:hypothetical protein
MSRAHHLGLRPAGETTHGSGVAHTDETRGVHRKTRASYPLHVPRRTWAKRNLERARSVHQAARAEVLTRAAAFAFSTGDLARP